MDEDSKRRESIIKAEYMADAGEKMLHLGCGYQAINGWLNTDKTPLIPQAVTLDATGPFDFADNTFDYVFSQHMIEHMSFEDGQRMLAECVRVLKPGGVMRISTPDLAFLIALCRDERSDIQNRYIEWATKTILRNVPLSNPAFVINNFVRAWGHRFIYDEETLRFAMDHAGLCALERRLLNESTHASLRRLENETRLPEGFLRLETFTLEGVKPEK